MHTHTCMHEHVNVLTPSFWLVARVPTPLRPPSLPCFFSLWWAVCVALFLLVTFYIVTFTYTYVHTYKIVISMRPIPPTAQMFPTLAYI